MQYLLSYGTWIYKLILKDSRDTTCYQARVSCPTSFYSKTLKRTHPVWIQVVKIWSQVPLKHQEIIFTEVPSRFKHGRVPRNSNVPGFYHFHQFQSISVMILDFKSLVSNMFQNSITLRFNSCEENKLISISSSSVSIFTSSISLGK